MKKTDIEHFLMEFNEILKESKCEYKKDENNRYYIKTKFGELKVVLKLDKDFSTVFTSITPKKGLNFLITFLGFSSISLKNNFHTEDDCYFWLRNEFPTLIGLNSLILSENDEKKYLKSLHTLAKEGKFEEFKNNIKIQSNSDYIFSSLDENKNTILTNIYKSNNKDFFDFYYNYLKENKNKIFHINMFAENLENQCLYKILESQILLEKKEKLFKDFKILVEIFKDNKIAESYQNEIKEIFSENFSLNVFLDNLCIKEKIKKNEFFNKIECNFYNSFDLFKIYFNLDLKDLILENKVENKNYKNKIDINLEWVADPDEYSQSKGEPYCFMLIKNDSDLNNIENRYAFIEKSARIKFNGEWIQVASGSGGNNENNSYESQEIYGWNLENREKCEKFLKFLGFNLIKNKFKKTNKRN